jgi:sugar phosphate isomerase/epimerase
MSEPRFGVSSRLFHDARLSRDHLVHIAAHGFDAVELFARRSHFDYTSESAGLELAEWLSDTRLALHAVHAPVDEGTDAIDDLLALTRHVPFPFLVLHPDLVSENTLPALAERAAMVGVRVALEVQNDPSADAAALVHLIEERLEDTDVGICLDFGHAHLSGDLGEAIETVSGHMFTTHVHDNRGRRDEHLVPYSGSIQWESAMMETQKIGYDGVLMFEPVSGDDPVEVLKQSVKARERLERAFVTF